MKNEKNVTKENDFDHEAAKRNAKKLNRKHTWLAIGAGVVTVGALLGLGWIVNR